MKNFLIFLFLSLIIVFFFHSTLDPDFGWQYRCGKMVFAGNPCFRNTLSAVMENYEWYRPVIFYPAFVVVIFDRFSFWGLTFTHVLIGLFSFFIFHKILKKDIILSLVAFVFATFLSLSLLRLGLRNQTFSLPFFLSTLYFLKLRSRFKLTFLPLTFFLWANTHESFLLGLIFLFLNLISDLRPKFLILNSLILILSFIATLINPFGFKIYQDIFNHLNIRLGVYPIY